MPRGDKSTYTDKQKRQAEHIEEGYEDRGIPEKEAERRAWATVNKETHGGKKSGSGRGVEEDHSHRAKVGILEAPLRPSDRPRSAHDPRRRPPKLESDEPLKESMRTPAKASRVPVGQWRSCGTGLGRSAYGHKACERNHPP